MLTTLAAAAGLFVATNIDDIVVLSLFFARGAGHKGTTAAILTGQYLGFLGILVASSVVGLGFNAVIPTDLIRYFGLIPLLLGLWAAWQAFRGEDDDEDISGKKLSTLAVAGVTFANGGDNIGVYVPVFYYLYAGRSSSLLCRLSCACSPTCLGGAVCGNSARNSRSAGEVGECALSRGAHCAGNLDFACSIRKASTV